MTVTQRTELFHLRMALDALGDVETLTKPRLSVPAAEAQLDDYAELLLELQQKTKAAIQVLEQAE